MSSSREEVVAYDLCRLCAFTMLLQLYLDVEAISDLSVLLDDKLLSRRRAIALSSLSSLSTLLKAPRISVGRHEEQSCLRASFYRLPSAVVSASCMWLPFQALLAPMPPDTIHVPFGKTLR